MTRYVCAREHALLALAALLLLAHSWGFGPWIADDAAITFTYADNFSQHGEISLYPNGERVEGYSNPSWMMLMSLASWLGLLDPVATPKLLSILLQLGSLWLAFRITRRLLPQGSQWLAGFAPLLLAANVSFVAWGISGLENPLYSFAILLALDMGTEGKRGIGWGLVLALVCLTRPEGVLYAGVLFTVAALGNPTSRRDRMRLLIPLAIVALILLASCSIRWMVFRDLLPNTAYAKLGDSGSWKESLDLNGRAMTYLKDGLRMQSVGWALALAIPCFFQPLRRKTILALYGVVAAAAAFCLYARGDWMMLYRFLTPAYPALAILSVAGVSAIMGYLRTPPSPAYCRRSPSRC